MKLNPAFQDAISDHEAGWLPWWEIPPLGTEAHLEIWRREWPGSQIVARGQISPTTNVWGLYWRVP